MMLSTTPTPLAGLHIVQRKLLEDSRGFFSRLFCAEELSAAGFMRVAQVNQTLTRRRGAVRGLHFQRPPRAEIKLVSCTRGRIFDVAVDLRAGSDTFLHWHAEELDAGAGGALLIPEGFAHGFQALTDDVELIYCHSQAYSPQSEAGLHPHDERLSIAWPLPVTDLSARDRELPRVGRDFQGVIL